MVDKSHMRRVLEFQQSQLKRTPILRRGTEIASGLWSDPISEARHDYDGAQSGFEAAIAQTKSIVDAVMPDASSEQSLDLVWDSALEIAAHLVERHSTECSAVRFRDDILQQIRVLQKRGQ